MFALISKRCCAFLLFMAVGGCSMGRQVSSFSIDYNRAIARSRDEMLLLNILRATYREPFQFSTVSGVTGSLEMSGSIEGSADKLIQWRAHGREKDIAGFSPNLTLSTSSKPTFSVQPLSDKDFTSEMLMPITPQTVELLLQQNWDAEFILPLVIGSISCGDQTVQNSYHADRRTFALNLATSKWQAKLKFVEKPEATEPKSGGEQPVLSVAAEKAPTMLREGVGDNYKIELTGTNDDRDRALMKLSKTKKKIWTIEGLPELPSDFPEQPGFCSKSVDRGKVSLLNLQKTGEEQVSDATIASVEFRSIEAIIYYLGEAVRYHQPISYWSDCKEINHKINCSTQKILFDLKEGQPTSEAAVETDIHGRHYWIPAALDENSKDRTLGTLSVLSQLIALQTRDDSKTTPQPVINVGR